MAIHVTSSIMNSDLMAISCIIIWTFNLTTVARFRVSAINIRGRGASFPNEVYKIWQNTYLRLRQEHVYLEMQYDTVGSSIGRDAIFANTDIEYAGSDTERVAYPDLIEFPTMTGFRSPSVPSNARYEVTLNKICCTMGVGYEIAGDNVRSDSYIFKYDGYNGNHHERAIVMGYNLPNFGSNKLNLSMEQLVGIYNGTHRYWNDTTFSQNNPDGTLPNAKIIVIARADKSGSTSLFTSALSSVDQNWNGIYGTFSKGIDSNGVPYHWNSDTITYYGMQTRGVAGLLLSFQNSIGYLSVADVQDGVTNTALLQNGAGEYMSPTSLAVQNAMDYFAIQNPTALTFSLANSGGTGSYPIAGFTHFIIYKTQMKNCNSAKELVRYINWFLTEDTPRSDCEALGFAPLSSDMVNRIQREVIEQVYCEGRNMWIEVLADKENEGKVVDDSWQTAVAISVPISTVVLGVLIGYILLQKIKYWRLLNRDDWLIPIEDIVFYYDSRNNSSNRCSSLFARSARSLQSAQTTMDQKELDAMIDKVLQWPGKWKGYDIGVRLLEIQQMRNLTKQMKQEMLIIRDKIAHPNVVKFFGLTTIENEKYVIGEYCRKGSLADVLQDNRITMTLEFKLALALDVCQGMCFLHNQHLIHGNLKACVCFVDAKWTVKVGDWEFLKLLTLNNEENAMIAGNVYKGSLTKPSITSREFWVAPEVLRAHYKCKLTQECDVFSFAVLLQEIYTQEEPYSEYIGTSSTKEILDAICSSNLRPKIQLDIPVSIRQIMEIAWTDNPVSRPSFNQILQLMKRNNPLRKSVMDSVIQSMEDYTKHLEDCVEEKTIEFESAKKQMKVMMSSIIPETMANSISNGESIVHDQEKTMGVICVEITNGNDFANLHSKDKVRKITDLCTYLDLLGSKYSAFRYSSFGTSFMIVIGVGDVNNSRGHDVALKTAHMCLDILTHEHIDDSNCKPEDLWMVKLCIGAHVSRTTTGIVETDTPQFLLFSDLPDVARSLARSSDASKIHISMDLRKMLLSSNNFSTERSGLLIVRGVEYETFWLTGRTMKFSNSPMNSILTTRNTKIPTETKGKGESAYSPSPRTLAKHSFDKGDVHETYPLHHDTTTKSVLNCRSLPKCEKKTIFSNEIRPIETGTPKMANVKVKTVHQRRRTKQRSDMLPEVMEVTIDIDDNFAEV